MFKQEAVNGIFDRDRFGRNRRVKFERVLPLGCLYENKIIGVRDNDAFFFFKIPEISDRKVAADPFDLFRGWVKFPLIQGKMINSGETLH